MDIFIIFIIIAAFFVIISTTKSYIPFISREGFRNKEKKCKKNCNIYKLNNFKNVENNKLNSLENKQYYFKQDCIWNDECELKPNNYNFFKYNAPKKTNINIFSCKFNTDHIPNHKSYTFEKKNLNKPCPCMIQNLHNHDLVIKRCIKPSFITTVDVKIPKTCKHSYNLGKL